MVKICMNLIKLSKMIFVIGCISLIFALLLPISIYSGFYDYVELPLEKKFRSYVFGAFGFLSIIISYITFQIQRELQQLNKDTTKQIEEYSLKFVKK